MFVFDTSSFLSLARYYLPFDHQKMIYKHVKQALENKRIILIDEVLQECSFVAKGIVLQKLDFLTEKSFLKSNDIPIKTKDIIPVPPKKFYNMVDYNFTTPVKSRVTDVEFERHKQEFLDSADARMVIYVFNYQHENPLLELAIVTEESGQANDNKAFKKIPAICDQLNIQSITLPDYLASCDDLDMNLG